MQNVELKIDSYSTLSFKVSRIDLKTYYDLACKLGKCRVLTIRYLFII